MIWQVRVKHMREGDVRGRTPGAGVSYSDA
jgi:hypothetical protein